MPQGRRKVPFSAKQKKLQLQNKRKKKQESKVLHVYYHFCENILISYSKK